MSISFSDFTRRCNEIAGENEQPNADLVINSARVDALELFERLIEDKKDKVCNS